jgi:hypothetical protein
VRTGAPELANALAQVDRLDRRACRAAVERRFSMERMADDHAAFYERRLAAHPARATTARPLTAVG